MIDHSPLTIRRIAVLTLGRNPFRALDLSHVYVISLLAGIFAITMSLCDIGDRGRAAGSDHLPRHPSALRDGADVPALPARAGEAAEATPGLDAPPVAQGPPRPPRLALIAAAVAPVIYLFVYYDYIIDRIIYVDDLTWADMAMRRARSSSWCWRRRGASSAGRCRITAMVFLAYALFFTK